MSNSLIKLDLSKLATSAAWHSLQSATVKSRVDSRRHSKITAQLKTKAMREEPPGSEQFVFTEGSIELNEELFDYLEDRMDEALDRGVPGNMGAGFGELVEAVEKARPTAEK